MTTSLGELISLFPLTRWKGRISRKFSLTIMVWVLKRLSSFVMKSSFLIWKSAEASMAECPCLSVKGLLPYPEIFPKSGSRESYSFVTRKICSFPSKSFTVSSRWMYRMRMMQQARLNAKPSKLIRVYDLLLKRKRTAYVIVFMFLVLFNYSLFITKAGSIFAAFRICHQSVPMEMSATISKATTKMPIPIGAFTTKSAVYWWMR